MVVWVASLGGALHEPVATYYYLELGATEMDIGRFSAVKSVGLFFLAPIYGHFVDRAGAYPVMQVACFFCASGCLVRGLAPDVPTLYLGNLLLGLGAANLYTACLSYVALQTPRAERSAVVSAFLLQTTILRMAARAAYPTVDHLLAVTVAPGKLVRDRCVMSVCTLFCFWGIHALLRDPHKRDTTRLAAEEATAEALEAGISGSDDGAKRQAVATVSTSSSSAVEAVTAAAAAAAPAPALSDTELRDLQPSRSGFVLCTSALVVQALAITVCRILWPLYLRDRYGWGARRYAMALLLGELAAAGTTAVLPAIERRAGRFGTASGGCLLAGALAAIAFHTPGKWVRDLPLLNETAAHVCVTVALLSIVAALEPSIKSLASLHRPQHEQGTSFGMMSMATASGQMLGSTLGSWLYTVSKATPSPVTGHGALPMVMVGVLLALAALLLRAAKSVQAKAVRHVEIGMTLDGNRNVGDDSGAGRDAAVKGGESSDDGGGKESCKKDCLDSIAGVLAGGPTVPSNKGV